LPSSDLAELPASGAARHLATGEASVSLASCDGVYAVRGAKVTEEMIEAGIASLESFMLEGEILRLEYRDAITAIFLAMHAAEETRT